MKNSQSNCAQNSSLSSLCVFYIEDIMKIFGGKLHLTSIICWCVKMSSHRFSSVTELNTKVGSKLVYIHVHQSQQCSHGG